MTTLADMRTLVRAYLDDISSDTAEQRWSDAEIDFALEASLESVLATLAPLTSWLDQRTTLPTSNGTVSLAALKVLYLKGVEHQLGTVYQPLAAADHTAPTAFAQDGELRITYVGRPAFPTNPASEIVYGGTQAPLKVIDRQLGRLAALDLLPKDAEQNRPLSEQAASGWADIAKVGRGPGATEIVPVPSLYGNQSFYTSGYAQSLRYHYDAATAALSLVH